MTGNKSNCTLSDDESSPNVWNDRITIEKFSTMIVIFYCTSIFIIVLNILFVYCTLHFNLRKKIYNFMRLKSVAAIIKYSFVVISQSWSYIHYTQNIHSIYLIYFDLYTVNFIGRVASAVFIYFEALICFQRYSLLSNQKGTFLTIKLRYTIIFIIVLVCIEVIPFALSYDVILNCNQEYIIVLTNFGEAHLNLVHKIAGLFVAVIIFIYLIVFILLFIENWIFLKKKSKNVIRASHSKNHNLTKLVLISGILYILHLTLIVFNEFESFFPEKFYLYFQYLRRISYQNEVVLSAVYPSLIMIYDKQFIKNLTVFFQRNFR